MRVVRPTDVCHRRYRRPVVPMGSRPAREPEEDTMLVEAQVPINGSKAAIWAAMTNIENASETISGIERLRFSKNRQTGS